MKVHLVQSMVFLLTIDHIVLCLKYQNIGDCHYYDDIVGKCSLTFICVNNPRNTTLFNSNVKSVCLNQHLYHRYKDGFSKYWIGTINFQDCEQMRIPKSLFEVYDRVHTFNISDIGLESMKSVDFIGAKRLIKLIASHNNIVEIPANLLNQSVKLTTVDFSFNQINRFDSDALPSGNQLEILDLSFNNIVELNVNTFQKLTELKQLTLSNNQIIEIPSFLFHKSDELVDLNLSFNKIQKMDDFAFSGDLNLKKLNLSHNQLTSLPRKTAENLSNLTHLDISSNRITVLMADAFECLENMVFLDASDNPLGKVDNQSFWSLVKLQQLILSRTALTQLDPGVFATLQNLEKLDISENQLQTLDINILPMLPNQLKLISIAKNQLRELHGFSSTRIPLTKIIGIDSNRFNCTYFERIFESITWKHLEAISKRINCSTVDEKDEETNKNSQFSANLIQNNSKTSTNLIVLTLFNAFCMTVFVITLLWIGIRKKLPQNYRFVDLFYRWKGAETLTNDIEIGE